MITGCLVIVGANDEAVATGNTAGRIDAGEVFLKINGLYRALADAFVAVLATGGGKCQGIVNSHGICFLS